MPQPNITNIALLSALAFRSEPGRADKNGVESGIKAAQQLCDRFDIDPNAPFTVMLKAATSGEGKAETAKEPTASAKR